MLNRFGVSAALAGIARGLGGCHQDMMQCPVLIQSGNANNKLKLVPNSQDGSYSAILICGQAKPTLVGKFGACLSEASDDPIVTMLFSYCSGGGVITPSPSFQSSQTWGGVTAFQSTESPQQPTQADPVTSATNAITGAPTVTTVTTRATPITTTTRVSTMTVTTAEAITSAATVSTVAAAAAPLATANTTGGGIMGWFRRQSV